MNQNYFSDEYFPYPGHGIYRPIIDMQDQVDTEQELLAANSQVLEHMLENAIEDATNELLQGDARLVYWQEITSQIGPWLDAKATWRQR